jgi:uncharacterized protein (DUF952 family)
MAIIYHISNLSAWAEAQAQGSYLADSLASEGFIHCSTPAQIVATANRYYAGQRGLLLLAIAPAQVKSEVRYENLVGGSDLFPHIYGPLNLDAVTAVLPFEPDPDGAFTHLPQNAPAG